MTPKEKAEELVNKMYHTDDTDYTDYVMTFAHAQQCALIAVDEILETLDSPPIRTGNESHMLWKATVDYWQQVKQEIEKL